MNKFKKKYFYYINFDIKTNILIKHKSSVMINKILEGQHIILDLYSLISPFILLAKSNYLFDFNFKKELNKNKLPPLKMNNFIEYEKTITDFTIFNFYLELNQDFKNKLLPVIPFFMDNYDSKVLNNFRVFLLSFYINDDLDLNPLKESIEFKTSEFYFNIDHITLTEFREYTSLKVKNISKIRVKKE